MLSKDQGLQCPHNFPTKASYDRLTLIKCMVREELEALQRKVMPFNDFSFRDIMLRAANTSQCELLSGD